MVVELAKYESENPEGKNNKIENIVIDLRKANDYFKNSEKLSELFK